MAKDSEEEYPSVEVFPLTEWIGYVKNGLFTRYEGDAALYVNNIFIMIDCLDTTKIYEYFTKKKRKLKSGKVHYYSK